MNPNTFWCYADKPLATYETLLPQELFVQCQNLSRWNMYYLSNPYLDVDFNRTKPLNPSEYTFNLKALAFLHPEYKHLPTLASDLLKRPSHLRIAANSMELWQFDDFIGKGWWDIFDARLASAEKREKPEPRQVVNNVIYAQFGQKRTL